MISRYRFRMEMIAIVAAGSLLQGGCYSNSPNRFELNGEVTRDGQPVAYGVIFFEPDAKKGGSGPQGSAQIREGVYQTKPDFGVVEGPHMLRIVTYDGKSSGPFAPYGSSLPEYRTEVDIRRDAPSIDFEIGETKK
jgi:hypothetical protein